MADTLYADVSEWQVGVNDTYPYPVLCIRSNDGTYGDRRWVNNYGWCLSNVDSGRLTFFRRLLRVAAKLERDGGDVQIPSASTASKDGSDDRRRIVGGDRFPVTSQPGSMRPIARWAPMSARRPR